VISDRVEIEEMVASDGIELEPFWRREAALSAAGSRQAKS
jgi:hypothetical protein